MADTIIGTSRECEQCLTSFIQPGRGKLTGRPRRYCSDKCKSAARLLRPYLGERKICEVCGLSFSRRPHGKDAGLCCSRECGFKLMRLRGQRPPATPQWVRDRAMYRRWSERTKREQANRDRVILSARTKLLASLARYIFNPKVACDECGKPLGITHRRSKLCPPCARHRSKAAPSRRADKAYRKALSRGRIAGAERFDPLEILARDGWRCHLCGISTPKRLRGSYHDQAPELDHIVPLSLGGQHTRLNTACACRRCNGAKGARPMGQLRLAA
jgi:5-methylcytosine-specific restriction endonuclease McrA